MCYEDIRIGRNSSSSQRTVITEATSKELIESNPFRTGLVIAAPSSDAVWVSMGGTAIVGEGIRLAVGDSPLIFDISHQGDIVRRRWSVIPTAATPNISVLETSYNHGDALPIFPA